MKAMSYRLVLCATVFLFLLAVNEALGVECTYLGVQGDCLENPLAVESIPISIGMALRGLLSVIGTIALIMFMYGGVLWMTAFGEEQKIKRGWDTMIWSSIGLAVIFGSYISVSFLFTGILGTAPPAATSTAVPAAKPLDATPIPGITPVPVAERARRKAERKSQVVDKPDFTKFPHIKNVKIPEVPSQNQKFDDPKHLYSGYDAIRAKYDKMRQESAVANDVLGHTSSFIFYLGNGELNKDNTTEIHENGHSINGAASVFYVGDGYALIIPTLITDPVTRSDIAKDGPKFLETLGPYNYFEKDGDPNDLWSAPPDMILDEFAAYTLSAQYEAESYKNGKPYKPAFTSNPISESVTWIPFVLQLGVSQEKHVKKEEFEKQAPRIKDGYKFLIQRAMEPYLKYKNNLEFDENANAANALSRLKNDASPEGKALRDLARRWFNTKEDPNWTGIYLGF